MPGSPRSSRAMLNPMARVRATMSPCQCRRWRWRRPARATGAAPLPPRSRRPSRHRQHPAAGIPPRGGSRTRPSSTIIGASSALPRRRCAIPGLPGSAAARCTARARRRAARRR
eukprot:10131662-Lingulodinium_polyedra.AAC.1